MNYAWAYFRMSERKAKLSKKLLGVLLWPGTPSPALPPPRAPEMRWGSRQECAVTSRRTESSQFWGNRFVGLASGRVKVSQLCGVCFDSQRWGEEDFRMGRIWRTSAWILCKNFLVETRGKSHCICPSRYSAADGWVSEWVSQSLKYFGLLWKWLKTNLFLSFRFAGLKLKTFSCGLTILSVSFLCTPPPFCSWLSLSQLEMFLRGSNLRRRLMKSWETLSVCVTEHCSMFMGKPRACARHISL